VAGSISICVAAFLPFDNLEKTPR